MRLPPVTGLAVHIFLHMTAPVLCLLPGGCASHLNVSAVLFTFLRAFHPDPKMTEEKAVIAYASYQLDNSVSLSLNSTKGDPSENAKQRHKSFLEALVINIPPS